MIRAPRRLTSAVAARVPSPVGRLLDADRRPVPSVGDVAGLSMSYGHLRIGRIGAIDPMPVGRNSTDVARRSDGADLADVADLA